MKKFLQNIQNSPEHVKGRWLVGLSAVAMIVVIFVWLAYFNTLIAPPGEPQQQTSQTERNSFWDTMKQGASVIGSVFGRGIRGFGNTLETPRDYIVDP